MINDRRIGERRAPLAPIGDAILKAIDKKPKRHGARVFVHPRCASGPAFGAMVANLEANGFDFNNIRLFAAFHNRHELVLEVEGAGAVKTYERMDGVQFKHRMGQTSPEPGFA